MNVLDYGADPAASDNTHAFNEAARLAGSVAAGGVILVPNGDYRIGGEIRPPPNCANVRFEGETAQGARLLHNGGGRLFNFELSYRGSGLSHLSLIGGVSTTQLLELAGSSDNYFSDLWLDGAAGTTAMGGGTTGIRLYGTQSAPIHGGSYTNTFDRITVEDCGVGIQLISTPERYLIAQNRFRNVSIRPRKFALFDAEGKRNELVGLALQATTCNLFEAMDIEQVGWPVALTAACVDDTIMGSYIQSGCKEGQLFDLKFWDSASTIQVIGGTVGNPSLYAAHPQVVFLAQGRLGVLGHLLV